LKSPDSEWKVNPLRDKIEKNQGYEGQDHSKGPFSSQREEEAVKDKGEDENIERILPTEEVKEIGHGVVVLALIIQ